MTRHAAELELAHVCERTHRLEESLELCARLLRRDRQCGPARIIRARVLRRLEKLDDAQQELRDWLPTLPDSSLAAEGWGELALLEDAMGKYDDAWDAMGRGKRMYLERDAAERNAAAHVADRFAKMVAALTPGHFSRWCADTASDQVASPVALLCGFPRSGTTLLEQVLDPTPPLSAWKKGIFSPPTSFPT